MDIAKSILDNVEADERQKALAQHAFEVAPHEHALAPMLAQINIPRDAKADLWNAKRQSMHDPKLTRLMQIAALPKDLLAIAEAHPNVTKLLMTEEKEKSGEKSSKGAAKEPKEAKTDKKSESAPEQSVSALPVREPGVSAIPPDRNASTERPTDPDLEHYPQREREFLLGPANSPQ